MSLLSFNYLWRTAHHAYLFVCWDLLALVLLEDWAYWWKLSWLIGLMVGGSSCGYRNWASLLISGHGVRHHRQPMYADSRCVLWSPSMHLRSAVYSQWKADPVRTSPFVPSQHSSVAIHYALILFRLNIWQLQWIPICLWTCTNSCDALDVDLQCNGDPTKSWKFKLNRFAFYWHKNSP